MSIYTQYAKLFAKKNLYGLHKRLYMFSLRGMGMLNSETDYLTGDDYIFKLLKKNKIDVIFDVGANIGNYSLSLLKIIPTAKILCFEPHPNTFKKLETALKGKSIQFFQLGIGKENGITSLFDYGEGTEHASFSKGVIEQLHNQNSQEFKIEIKTIDRICLENQITKIGLLKIDVEGFEFDVLLGAKNLLKNNSIDLIQFEFNASNILSKTSITDFKSLLNNYQLYRIFPDGLVNISKEHHTYTEIFVYQNILAINKSLKIRQ